MIDRTAGRRYVAALTGMRGVAACLVFLNHYAAPHPGVRLDQAVPLIGVVLHFPFAFGFAGVDIFFVLSGFLLTVPESVAHLLMFFNIGWDPVRPMVGVWWTLPVELGFYLVLPLLAMAVSSLYWGCRIGTWLLANRVVYFLGLISYSLYLWQFVVMQQIQLLFADRYAAVPHWVTFPIATGAVIAVAAASYFLVERPFYRLQPWRRAFRTRSEPRE